MSKTPRAVQVPGEPQVQPEAQAQAPERQEVDTSMAAADEAAVGTPDPEQAATMAAMQAELNRLRAQVAAAQAKEEHFPKPADPHQPYLTKHGYIVPPTYGIPAHQLKGQ